MYEGRAREADFLMKAGLGGAGWAFLGWAREGSRG